MFGGEENCFSRVSELQRKKNKSQTKKETQKTYFMNKVFENHQKKSHLNFPAKDNFVK